MERNRTEANEWTKGVLFKPLPTATQSPHTTCYVTLANRGNNRKVFLPPSIVESNFTPLLRLIGPPAKRIELLPFAVRFFLPIWDSCGWRPLPWIS